MHGIFSSLQKYPILSGLYSLLFFRYLEFSIWSIFLLYQLELYETSPNENSIPFIFLKSLPYLGIIPIIYILSNITIAIAIIRLSKQSRFSLIFSALSMFIVFTLTTFGVIYIRDNLSNVGSFANGETKYTQIFYSPPFAVDNPIEAVVEPFLPPLFIRYTFNPYHTYSLILIVLLILLITIPSLKYKYVNKSPTQAFLSRIILLSIVIVNFLGFGALGFFYSNAFYPDTWYEKSQKLVNFKVLKPTYLPPGFEQTVRFNLHDDTLTNSSDVSKASPQTKVRLISSGYGSNNFKDTYNQPTGFIVLKQYEIPSNFEFEQMIINQTHKLLDERVEKVSLDQNKKATIISGKNRATSTDNTPGSNVIKIYFTTSDNTLVHLIGIINKNYRKDDYIYMVKSLE